MITLHYKCCVFLLLGDTIFAALAVELDCIGWSAHVRLPWRDVSIFGMVLSWHWSRMSLLRDVSAVSVLWCRKQVQNMWQNRENHANSDKKGIVPTTRQYCRLHVHEVMSQNSTGARDKCTQLDLLQVEIILIYVQCRSQYVNGCARHINLIYTLVKQSTI